MRWRNGASSTRRITQDEYDKKARELKERQTELALRIEQHQKSEGDFRTTLESLISLASRVELSSRLREPPSIACCGRKVWCTVLTTQLNRCPAPSAKLGGARSHIAVPMLSENVPCRGLRLFEGIHGLREGASGGAGARNGSRTRFARRQGRSHSRRAGRPEIQVYRRAAVGRSSKPPKRRRACP